MTIQINEIDTLLINTMFIIDNDNHYTFYIVQRFFIGFMLQNRL